MTPPRTVPRYKPSKLLLFNGIRDKKDTEPALRTGVNTSAVAGILTLIAFLWPGLLSNHTSTIILVISAFVLPIVTAIFTRNKVWSIASVTELVDEAVKAAEESATEAAKKRYRRNY